MRICQINPQIHKSSDPQISINSVVTSVSTSTPASVTSTSSSMRTPPHPGRYAPGSIVKIIPGSTGSSSVSTSGPRREIRGSSCTSMPRPWPVPWPNASASPWRAEGVPRRRVDRKSAIGRAPPHRLPGHAPRERRRRPPGPVDLPSRPTLFGSSRRSMSRTRRRSPAPRGRLRLLFARRVGRAAGRRWARRPQSYQTPDGSNPACRTRRSMASATSRSD